ncbi:DUF3265 domain-containing protein [Vibrio vulnificus]
MRNAWHFYYALVLVIKVVCGGFVLRCSPLNRALGAAWAPKLSNEQQWRKNGLF